MRWDDVNARARGLATHLLDRSALANLAAARDWLDFLARVAATGYPLDGGGAQLDAPGFDRAVSRVALGRMNLLDRWLAGRRAVLAVVLEDEERMTLRALLRGAAQGSSPGARLHDAAPTSGLPIRVLERLARVTTVAEFAREVTRHGHPAGRVLEAELEHDASPGLRVLEWSLARLFAERAVRAARRGGPVVRRFAADLIDQQNVWTLLLAAPPEVAAVVDAEFLAGGRHLTRPLFARLRSRREVDALRSELCTLLDGTPLGVALASEPFDMASLEARTAAARIAWLRRLARRDPLGPAVVLAVLERIRAEARALRAIAWGISFDAPPSALASLMPEAA